MADAPDIFRRPNVAATAAKTLGLTLMAASGLLFITAGLPAWSMPILLLLTGVLIFRMRRQRALRVLQYLDRAMRTGLPLPAFLRAAARDEKADTGLALLGVSDAIAGGEPLCLALARWLPMMPARPLAMVAMGERTGRLTPALRRATRQWERAERQTHETTWLALGYVLMMSGLICMILAFFMVFIVPAFREIFNDFGGSLSPWLVLPDRIVGAPLVLVGLTAGVLVPLIVIVGSQTVSARGTESLRRLTDPFTWWLPGLHGLQRDRALGDAFAALADLLDAGLTIDRAVDEVSRLHMNRAMRRKLVGLAGRLREGQPLPVAAAGLPAMVRGLLGTVGDQTDLVATARFLGEYYDSRADRDSAWFRAILVPAVVLTAGAAIGMFVYGIVDCITILIDLTVQESGLTGVSF